MYAKRPPRKKRPNQMNGNYNNNNPPPPPPGNPKPNKNKYANIIEPVNEI